MTWHRKVVTLYSHVDRIVMDSTRDGLSWFFKDGSCARESKSTTRFEAPVLASGVLGHCPSCKRGRVG